MLSVSRREEWCLCDTATGHDMGLDHSQEARATNKVVTVRQGWYYRPSCHQIVILTLTMGGDNHNIANNFHSEFDTNFQLRAEDEK